MNTNCERCGRPIEARGTRFCSRACYLAEKNDAGTTEHRCEVCGTVFKAQRWRNITPTPPRFCDRACAGMNRRREPERTERGAESQAREIHDWRQSLKWRAFQRAWIATNPRCDVCGAPRAGRNLVVHHPVDPNPTRDAALLFAPSNLVVLCRACHASLHAPTRTARSRLRAP